MGVKDPSQLIVQGQFILVSHQRYYKKKKLNIPYEFICKNPQQNSHMDSTV